MKLQANKIRKRYGSRQILNGLSLSVESGEIVGLLGPNGAGKTTTFYSVVGMVSPEEGEIILEGNSISKTPMHQRAQLGIGYLPQDPSIFRKLTVEDNLKIILETLPLTQKEQKEKMEYLLSELGLENRTKQFASTLSGGEKRRLEICRALLINPKFLLLDEPFVGIDPITIHDLQKILIGLKEKGLGILITDHNVRDTLQIIDRAYLIYKGEVLIEGNSKTIMEDPQARKIYLGEKFSI